MTKLTCSEPAFWLFPERWLHTAVGAFPCLLTDETDFHESLSSFLAWWLVMMMTILKFEFVLIAISLFLVPFSWVGVVKYVILLVPLIYYVFFKINSCFVWTSDFPIEDTIKITKDQIHVIKVITTKKSLKKINRQSNATGLFSSSCLHPAHYSWNM